MGNRKAASRAIIHAVTNGLTRGRIRNVRASEANAQGKSTKETRGKNRLSR